MHSYSGPLQRKLDMHRACQCVPLTGYPSGATQLGAPMGPMLQPLQALAYADNLQMTMYRNNLFMDRVATAPFMEGEDGLGLSTWGLFNSNVR